MTRVPSANCGFGGSTSFSSSICAVYDFRSFALSRRKSFPAKPLRAAVRPPHNRNLSLSLYESRSQLTGSWVDFKTRPAKVDAASRGLHLWTTRRRVPQEVRALENAPLLDCSRNEGAERMKEPRRIRAPQRVFFRQEFLNPQELLQRILRVGEVHRLSPSPYRLNDASTPKYCRQTTTASVVEASPKSPKLYRGHSWVARLFKQNSRSIFVKSTKSRSSHQLRRKT